MNDPQASQAVTELAHRLLVLEAQRAQVVAALDATIAQVKAQMAVLLGLAPPSAAASPTSAAIRPNELPSDKAMRLLLQEPPPTIGELCIALYGEDSPVTHDRLSRLFYDMHHRRRLIRKKGGQWVVNPSYGGKR